MADRFDGYQGNVNHYPFTIAGTTSTTIASGVTNYRLVPLSMVFTCAGSTCAVTIKDTNDTDLAHGTAGGLLINNGFIAPHNPYGCFKPTGSGYGIKMQTNSADATVAGCLVAKTEIVSTS